jgi:Cu+-exporting ATPase
VQTVSGSMTYEALIGNERLLQSSAGSTTDSNKSEKTYAAWSTKQISSLFIDETLSRFQTSGCSTAIFAMHQKSDNENDAAKTLRPSLIFAIADPIRPEAPSVLSSLRSNNISVHMCTGDNQTTAHAIASQLGIPVSNIRAGVTPQEKATYIKELQYPDSLTTEAISTTNKPSQKSPRKIVAFVGDGTNDTPALTVSDVSIAISHSTSSDVALTSSSFILLNSSLDSILTLVTLSRRVFQRVKINFAWAAVYNVVLIPVAAGVFFAVGANAEHGGWRFSPVWASAAMAGSSVSVVLSSLALRLPEMRVERVLRRVLGEKKGL